MEWAQSKLPLSSYRS